jgi:hypothetical protein
MSIKFKKELEVKLLELEKDSNAHEKIDLKSYCDTNAYKYLKIFFFIKSHFLKKVTYYFNQLLRRNFII